MAGIGFRGEPQNNIPTRSSGGDEWASWYMSLKSNFGRKKSNEIFLKAWKIIADKDKANTEYLRDVLESEGKIKLQGSSIDSIVDLGGDIGDNLGDIFTASKWLGITMGGIVVLGIGLLIYNIARKPEIVVGAAVKAAKGGI